VEKIFNTVITVLKRLVESIFLFVALTILLQLVFGSPLPFIGVNVVANVQDLISTLGSNGLAGLLALIAILAIFRQAKK